MKNKNQFGFLIILFAAAFATLFFVIFPTIYNGNEQVTTQTQQVVREFYGWYVTYDGHPLVDHTYRSSEYLSPGMVAFLDEFAQGGMEYDPVLCAQEIPTDIKISPAQVSGGQATLNVTTNFEGHVISIELVQIDGDWLIDKIDCAP